MLCKLAIALAVLSTMCSVAQGQEAVTDYRSCVEAGNRVLKIYPPVCVTPDGGRFKDDSRKPAPTLPVQPSCRNLCGDGVCQEIVCMAIGCPCSESKDNCPEDCK